MPPLVAEHDVIPGWVGSAPKSQHIRREVHRLRPLPYPVLVQGETGTGKELVARAFAVGSTPLVIQNCATDHGDRWDDELFGHEPHSFTDAATRHLGWFESAAGGVLVLDEFGDLPLKAQGALLRMIEGQTFRRVGGRDDVKPRVRVIATTNCDLREAVRLGRFRLDLYARFQDRLVVPALVERLQDVPALVAAYHAELCRKRRAVLPKPTPQQVRQWQRQRWPDNVRGLQAAVRQVAFGGAHPEYRPRSWAQGSEVASAPVAGTGVRPSAGEIAAVLRACDGNRTHAAAHLGVNRTTLWRWQP